jgi:hypothetical protein
MESIVTGSIRPRAAVPLDIIIERYSARHYAGHLNGHEAILAICVLITRQYCQDLGRFHRRVSLWLSQCESPATWTLDQFREQLIEPLFAEYISKWRLDQDRSLVRSLFFATKFGIPVLHQGALHTLVIQLISLQENCITTP